MLEPKFRGGTVAIYSNMHSRSKSSLKLLELDLPLLHPSKPLRGSLVKSSSPALAKKKQWRGTESFKPIDFESIETLLLIKSTTPTILDKTKRTLRAPQTVIATKLDSDKYIRAVIGRTSPQARVYGSSAYFTYDSAQVPSNTATIPRDYPETYSSKLRARLVGSLVRRTAPLSRNSFLFRPKDLKPEVSSLRPSIIKSRLFRPTAS